MFKVHNKDNRTMPMAINNSVSIVNFEQVNAGSLRDRLLMHFSLLSG